METSLPKQLFSPSKRPAGEPFVWFTGIGLALGMMMILYLLGLIFIRGIDVFWPKRVAQIEFVEPVKMLHSQTIAGVITKKQKKLVRSAEDIEKNKMPMEWQMFLGNKDEYGLSFKYFDAKYVAAVTYPSGMMRIERLEYGDAFGYPVALGLNEQNVMDVDHPQFLSVLYQEVNAANERWDRIREIERDHIGKLNLELEKNNVQLRKTSPGEAEKITALQTRREELDRRYEILAAQAREMREQQNDNHLVIRLATGEKKRIEIGNIVHFYFPNQLNWAQRVGLFFHKIFLFFIEDPREANTEGGVFPAIFGTFVMTVLMSMAVMPFGVMAAIYLREYARQGFWVRCVRIAVNNLAGVPSIVFGVFGVGFFIYFVGGSIDQLFFKDSLPTPTFGTGGILWASLTLALLTVPVVIVAAEEAIAAVPRGMREGSLACGASKWQTIKSIVLPASAPGILTGLILAMARGASEVAPLMIVGAVKLAPSLPIDDIFPFVHLERKFMHLGFHIYDLGFQSPDSEAAKPMVFATTLLLISLVVALNLGAIFIRERLRKKYATGAF